MAYTNHGHHIPGSKQGGDEPAPAGRARCGGPGLCSPCSIEAQNWLQRQSELEDKFVESWLKEKNQLVVAKETELAKAYDHGPDTLSKVTKSLTDAGFGSDVAEDIVRVLHNNGIVFREVTLREPEPAMQVQCWTRGSAWTA